MRIVAAVLLGMVASGVLSPALGRCESGAAVFAEHCAICHGSTGRTDTSVARALKVRPLVADARLARMNAGEITELIRTDPKHRGVVCLEDADVAAAAVYVKELAKRKLP